MCPPSGVQSHDALSNSLLDWYACHARDLPWRRGRTPYRVWVAEVMLQQTQVDTVIPYYRRFLGRFPTIAVLAEADLGDVLRAWEGLGYYARARNLHAAAKRVVDCHGGRLPHSFGELTALPELGLALAREGNHDVRRQC